MNSTQKAILISVLFTVLLYNTAEYWMSALSYLYKQLGIYYSYLLAPWDNLLIGSIPYWVFCLNEGRNSSLKKMIGHFAIMISTVLFSFQVGIIYLALSANNSSVLIPDIYIFVSQPSILFTGLVITVGMLVSYFYLKWQIQKEEKQAE